MMRKALLVMVGLGGILPVSRIQAQSLYAVSNVATTIQGGSPLATRVSVAFKETSLEDALREVARQAGVRLAYAGPVVTTQKSVTLMVDRETAESTLHAILQGTWLRYRLVGDQVVIERSQEKAVETGVIVGKVTDAKTGRPLIGAVVSVDGTELSVKTGNDGSFRLALPIGERTIRIRALGYVREVRRVSVTEEISVTIDIALGESASVLDEVVVTGTVVATERKALTTPITVITAADLEQRGITRIEQLFRGEVPSVFAMESGSVAWGEQLGAMQASRVYTRGVSALYLAGGESPLKTYIDGVEIFDPAYLGSLDPQSFERIEIITGPQAATIYGSGAIGGVMQIFTKKGSAGRAAETIASLKYGILQSNTNHALTPSHHHQLSTSGGVGSELSFSGNAGYQYIGQWQPDLFSRTMSGSLGAVLNKHPLRVSGSVSTSSAANGTSSIYGQLVTRVRMESGLLAIGAFLPSEFISQRVSRSTTHTLALNMDFNPTAWSQHHVTLGKTLTNSELEPVRPRYSRPADTLYVHGSSNGDRRTMNYNTTLMGKIGSFGSTLTVGINGSAGRRLTAQGCTNTTVDAGWNSCGSSNVGVSRLVGSRSVGGFGSLRLSVFDQLYVTVGVRGEKNPNYGQRHRIDWTPTNGVSYTTSFQDVTVKFLASYGMATRAPTPEMRMDQWSSMSTTYTPAVFKQRAANLLLRPEYARGPQGGVEIYWGNAFTLTVNRYNQKVTDLISAVAVDSILRVMANGRETWGVTRQMQNVGSVRQHGWELTGSGGWRALNVRGTYSWNDSRVLQSLVHEPGLLFNAIPTHTGNLQLGYAIGNSNVMLSSSFVGRSARSFTETWEYNEYGQSRIPVYADVHGTIGSRSFNYLTVSGYVKSDLVAQHRVTPSVTATLNVVNIGNNFGSELGDNFSAMLGRQTLLGLSFKFPRR